MKKNDLFIIAAVVIAAAAFLLFTILTSETGAYVRVLVDDEYIAYLPLDEDIRYEVWMDEGYNIIVISGSKASIVEADCTNQVCVNSAEISNVGDTICCMPHRLAITIVSDKE